MAQLKLTRNLNLTNALTLGIGTMIGAGIFILPSFAAERAGPAASISYLIGGLIAILTALSLSELATGMSKSGGSYYFINRSLGPFFGTITGIGMWMGLIFASAFYMIGFEYYLSSIVNPIDIYGVVMTTRAMAVLVTAALIAINYFGTKGVGKFQNIIVILLLIILAFYIIGGAYHVHFGVEENNLDPIAPKGWGPVIGVAGLVFIGFMGFEVVATVAEEIKNPERNLWLAMIGSVVIVTIFYMAVMLVATGIVPYEELGTKDTPISFTAEKFMGGPGRVLIIFAALLATVSSANASILSASRISLAMGKDNILHPWTNKLHEKFETPSHSILLTGAFILAFLIIGKVEVLAEVAGFMFLMTFVLIHGCVWVLRRTEPEWYKPSFRAPLFPYLQGLGAVLCLVLMLSIDPLSILTGLGLVGISLLWYRAWSSRKSKVVGEVKKVFEEIKLEEAKKVIHDEGEKRKKILVPFTNVLYETIKVKIAAALATKEGTLVRLNVVTIPEQTPVESAMEHIDVENIKIVEKIRELDEKVALPKVYKQIIAHSVPSAIVDVSRQENCELILLGKYKTRLPTARIRETLTNHVLLRAHVDIGVFSMNEECVKKVKKAKMPSIKRIMVPFDDNLHTILALEFARKIAVAEGATITLFQVSFKKDLKANEEKIGGILEDFSGGTFTIKPEIIMGRSPAKEIIAASKEYDLIVMGASKKWVLNKFFFGSIPDRVMDRASCPVLIAKKWERAAVSHVRGRMK